MHRVRKGIAGMLAVICVCCIHHLAGARTDSPSSARSLPVLKEDSITRYAATYSGVIYHYDLYVPPGYNSDPKQLYPVLFIFSPGGNATMGAMAGWIRQHRWLAVMLVESQNGPWEPIDGNFFAAHDDVIQRARIQGGRKYITGMSGGARAASRFSVNQYRPGFHGLFLQAAGAVEIYLENIVRPDLYVFASFGDNDPNLVELSPMQQAMPAQLFAYEVFSGGHEWAPQATAERALSWLEDQVERNLPAPSATLVNPAVTQLLLQKKVLFSADMSEAPSGWIATPGGLWQWGQPSCGPAAGYSGTSALSYNPTGNYAANMPAVYLVTPSIDCRAADHVVLTFHRWLEVESSTYDKATIEVSGGDGQWHQVWMNPASTLKDTAWTKQTLDISAWAAGQENVMVRWAMGPTDGSVQYCGWNLDDIRVLGW